MIEIIPSLLVESKEEFERKLRLVEPQCKTVHVDVLDGSLFTNTSWFDAAAVSAMRTNVRYELHLMVENPLPIIEDWAKQVANFDRAIVHAEMHRPVGAVLSATKDYFKKQIGVALNPETPLSAIHDVLHQIDRLTLLGVHPGQSGQTFLGEYILEKIREARNHAEQLAIEIDGGVTLALVPGMAQAGVTHICAASAIFQAEDVSQAIQNLTQAVSTQG